MEKLYENKISVKATSLIKIFIGSIVLIYAINLLVQEIYLETLSIIAPIFGFGLLINGLTAFKLKSITHNSANDSLEIIKTSLFREKIVSIPLKTFKVELRSDDGSFVLFKKIRLVLINDTKDELEMKSIIFSLNNNKLKKLYLQLKSI